MGLAEDYGISDLAAMVGGRLRAAGPTTAEAIKSGPMMIEQDRQVAKIRGALRELERRGLAEEALGLWQLTEAGRRAFAY